VSRKCRASKAKPLTIINASDNKIESCECWDTSYKFVYKVGKMAIPDSYDDDIRVECSNGIHFFITKKEAEEW